MAGSVIFRIVRLCPGVRVQCMTGSIMFKILCLMSTRRCSVYGRFYNVQDSLPYVHQAVFSLWPVLLCSRQFAYVHQSVFSLWPVLLSSRQFAYVQESVFSLWPVLLCSRQFALCPSVCVQFMAGSIMFKIVCLMSTSLCSVYGRFYYVQDSLPYVYQSMLSLWPVSLGSRQFALCPAVCNRFLVSSIMFKIVRLCSEVCSRFMISYVQERSLNAQELSILFVISSVMFKTVSKRSGKPMCTLTSSLGS